MLYIHVAYFFERQQYRATKFSSSGCFRNHHKLSSYSPVSCRNTLRTVLFGDKQNSFKILEYSIKCMIFKKNIVISIFSVRKLLL